GAPWQCLILTGPCASTSWPRRSPTRSPPERWWSGPPRRSRSWWRTRWTPAPATSRWTFWRAAAAWCACATTARASGAGTRGWGPEDARLSRERHATSKLRTKDDLFAIGTYGFRGEALPSIAAVSRFTLITCEPGAAAGTRIEVEGGRVLSVEDAGAPPGTTVEARDLFWNVPARRKFLKRAATEQAHAIEAVLRLALPRPEVEFTVRENGRVLLRLPAGSAAAVEEQRAVEALGPE